MSVTVLLVDDHPVVRSGLRAVLDADGTVEVVGEAGSGEEAIAQATRLRPDVVLCDLRLGDGPDGIRTTAALRALDHSPAVIILTTFDRDAEILAAIEAGAYGYLLKGVAPETIVQGIRAVAAGETFLTPDVAARVVHGVRNPPPSLTGRESEVLRLVADGATNRDVSRALVVSEATVKTHVENILDKLEVDSRSRAVHRARELGLI